MNEFLHETPYYGVVTCSFTQDGVTVYGYGIVNKRTGIREMEIRREDLALGLAQMWSEILHNLLHPEDREGKGAKAKSAVAHELH